MKEMQKKGFSEELLLQVEKDDWGQPLGGWDWQTRAKNLGVPEDARPIAIRELKCRRAAGLYNCDYLIDYGRNGQIEGTYRKRDEQIGKTQNGKWSIHWIFID